MPISSALLVLLAAASLLLTARLVWLQVVDGPRLAAAAQSQRTNVIAVHPRRGTIFDRNGNVLARSEECTTVYADPSLVKDDARVAAILSECLGGDAAAYEATLSQDARFAYVRRRVDDEAAERLRQRLAEERLGGIYYVEDSRRVYPYGNVGAQVLGFVGDEGRGLSGIELQYDDELSGTDGELVVETSPDGTPIAGSTARLSDPVPGQDLVLSVDVELQQACEQIVQDSVGRYDAESGSIMVCDPRNGEVLAACSTPLPDFSNLEDPSALNLRLVSDSFEPGSVFKVITTAMGMEMGLFGPDSSYNVPASIQVGDDKVTDDEPRSTAADMTVREMMRRSSNVGMALLVQDVIGQDRFSEWVDRFGIGHLTGIDYPGESAGIVKPLEQYDGSTAGSMSFGQGLAIPMVQVVRAYGAIANDGVPATPHFLIARDGQDVSWPLGEPVVSKQTADEETDVMRTVIQRGTGRFGAIEGYDIAGKTGTGEQASVDGGYEEGRYVASLCGFVNADDPQLLVYAGLNGLPHLASQTAAHVFHDVMQKSIEIVGVRPVS